jgi:hypothetical protein
MKKIIQISDELFWGFNIIIDLNNYSSIEEIGNLLKNELIVFLRSNNLLNLLDKAKELNLHHHNYSEYEELYNNNYDTIYFCGNCCR